MDPNLFGSKSETLKKTYKQKIYTWIRIMLFIKNVKRKCIILLNKKKPDKNRAEIHTKMIIEPPFNFLKLHLLKANRDNKLR